jgi:hypothetical protein
MSPRKPQEHFFAPVNLSATLTVGFKEPFVLARSCCRYINFTVMALMNDKQSLQPEYARNWQEVMPQLKRERYGREHQPWMNLYDEAEKAEEPQVDEILMRTKSLRTQNSTP